MLYAWNEIEAYIDVAFIAEFRLLGKLGPKAQTLGTPFDESDEFSDRRKFLLDATFNKKLEFLRKVGVVHKKESTTLRKFQKDRNRYFHGREPSFVYLDDSERVLIMDGAQEALINSHKLAMRNVEKLKHDKP